MGRQIDTHPQPLHNFPKELNWELSVKLRAPKRSDEMIQVSGDSDAWAASLGSIFVELDVEQLEAKAPTGRMYRYPFGEMTFIRAITRGGAHRAVRSRRLIQASTKNDFVIGFLISGSLTLTQGSGQAILRPGDMAIFDSTREYAIEVSRGFDALWIGVPRHRLEGRLTAATEVLAQRIDGEAGVGHVASNMLRAALEEAPQLLPAEASRIANHLLDLLSLALASPDRAAPPPSQSRYVSSTLRRVQGFIDTHLDDETLTPDVIAQAHYVSVRYLNKLFEREGTSLARWIRLRRLERCRSDIEDASQARQKISDIAYNHGFRNVSSFNRLFKSYFGCSPRALRNPR